MSKVQAVKLLSPITADQLGHFPVIAHGTYSKFWEAIKTTGNAIIDGVIVDRDHAAGVKTKGLIRGMPMSGDIAVVITGTRETVGTTTEMIVSETGSTQEIEIVRNTPVTRSCPSLRICHASR